MFVRQVIPRLAVRAVVLTDRAPLALTHIRTPQVPIARLPQPLLQPPEPLNPLTLNTHRFPQPSPFPRPRDRRPHARVNYRSARMGCASFKAA